MQIKFSKDKLVKRIALVTALALSFLFGEFVGVYHSTMEEINSNIDVLVRNLSILSYCDAASCNERVQDILINDNDIALQRYHVLNDSTKDIKGKIFWYTVWPVIKVIYSNRESDVSIEHVSELYSKIGCGLNGKICTGVR